jgi:hypothetical protein
MLTNWLEAISDERIQEPALHNALTKIYVESENKDVQSFLSKTSSMTQRLWVNIVKSIILTLPSPPTSVLGALRTKKLLPSPTKTICFTCKLVIPLSEIRLIFEPQSSTR